MVQQRFRVVFRKGERVRYISHLDVLRSWERAVRRAGLPLAYSQGFTPHPKLAFAAPLPVGFMGEAEIVDITLDEPVDAGEFACRLSAQTTDDLALLSAYEVPLAAPPPQSVLLFAEYRVVLQGICLDDAERRVAAFLESDEFPWTEERNEKTRSYNLRERVSWLHTAAADGGVELTMRLSAGQDAMGRPEQVVASLFPEADAGVYIRTALVLNETSPAREAWRRVGQFQ